MNTFIIIGSGNSGAGAIYDYLSGRDDFENPFGNAEFRLLNDPNGISDFYDKLYSNFNINKCANALYEFRKFVKDSINSRYNIKHKIYNKNFVNYIDTFIKNITELKYSGSPRFYLDKISLYKKIFFYFNRFFFNKNARNIIPIDMFLPVREDLFIIHAQKLIEDIIKHKIKDENKNIVIEQGANFFSPYSSKKFYKNSKIIKVTRDPKAIYWSMKRRNSLSYPGHDLIMFVNWFKKIMERNNLDDSKDVININFENFFINFKNEEKKLLPKLELNIGVYNNFDLNFTKKNLFKFKENLSATEIKYINSNLEKYVTC